MVVLILSTLTLTGCLSSQAVKPVPVPELRPFHPALPAAITLEDEVFLVCPHEDPKEFVCTHPEEMKKLLRNKTKLAAWMRDTRSVVEFYDPVPDPSLVKNK